ncbi:hypothetical protein OH768_23535 [Streptomyces sp. NBC_01622]|uniref:hypothetical protein n=1 Tax=Streptomyces sp. NBC_01622 TaxID=2975903 RepID=UPI003865277D|nr:hypothetical protein OH768_23535 [Streptomyces sp. NBC_01622]
MNRERQLAQAFVVLADTMPRGSTPLRLFHCLVHACRDLLDVDAAAVMIADAHGSLRTMATTDEDARWLRTTYISRRPSRTPRRWP